MPAMMGELVGDSLPPEACPALSLWVPPGSTGPSLKTTWRARSGGDLEGALSPDLPAQGEAFVSVNVGLSGWLECRERFSFFPVHPKEDTEIPRPTSSLWAASGHNPAPGFVSKKPLS